MSDASYRDFQIEALVTQRQKRLRYSYVRTAFGYALLACSAYNGVLGRGGDASIIPGVIFGAAAFGILAGYTPRTKSKISTAPALRRSIGT